MRKPVMTSFIREPKCWFGPAAFCRLDAGLVAMVATGNHTTTVLSGAALIAFACSAVYGAVFGLWRSPQQAVYSALKLPLLILCIAFSCSILSTFLAQALGAALSFRQVVTCMFVGFAVTALLLASLATVMLFFVLQSPSPASDDAMQTYRALLPIHTSLIGLCGFAGQVRVFRLLHVLTGSRNMAYRILVAWIAVCGLVGCELSWVFSPFLARPDLPVSFLNPNAFSGNFVEYLWRCMQGGLR
jgi:hypothetical protein